MFVCFTRVNELFKEGKDVSESPSPAVPTCKSQQVLLGCGVTSLELQVCASGVGGQIKQSINTQLITLS